MTSDPEAEEAVLCMMLSNEDASIYAFGKLKPDDFADPSHRLIYEAAKKCFESGQEVSPLTIHHQLRSDGNDVAAGSPSLPMELADKIVISDSIYAAVDFVLTASGYRRLGVVCRTIMQQVDSHSPPPPDEIIGKAIDKLNGSTNGDNPFLSKSCITDSLEYEADLEYRRNHENEYASWPWASVRSYMGPFRGGELITIGGQTHSAKSQVVAESMAWQALNGVPVGAFTLEMRRSQLGLRLRRIAQRIHPSRSIASLEDLSQFPVYVDERGFALDEICARIRILKQLKGVQVVYVDHVGLIEHMSKKGRSRTDEVGEITRRFLQLAQELNIDIVLVSQFNRFSKRQKSRPTTADLRDSGSIEQDSDVIILLSQSHTWDPNGDYTDDLTLTEKGEMIEWGVAFDIEKDRNGGKKRLMQLRFVKTTQGGHLLDYEGN